MAREKRALLQLQTAESREYDGLVERRKLLNGIISDCTNTLDSLTENVMLTGLEDLRADAFKEWLCDIGLCKLQTALRDIDGRTLTMLNVSDVMQYDVSFNDASALLLHGYMTHYRLNDDDEFAPPDDSVLSWDIKQTANWISSLGIPFTCLSSIGWHGAAICSLSMPRVIEASKGRLTAADAIKFIGLVRNIRSETDGDKATWVVKWSGANTIDNQAAQHEGEDDI